LFDTNIPILSYFIKKKRLRFLRGIVRGHNKLMNDNKMRLIFSLIDSIEKKDFCKSKVKFSPIIFGNCHDQAQSIIRQYLLSRTMYFSQTSFVKSLFYNIGINSKISCALPIEWRKVVEEYGFKVNYIKSQFYWFCFIIFMYCYGIFEIKKNFFISIINIIRNNKI